MKKIMIVGDIHAEFGWLNILINKKQPDIIIACGDFGYWPKYNKTGKLLGFDTDDIKPQKTKIYWCDGNHEHHDLLDNLVKDKAEPIEIKENVFFCPRGTILDINGENFLFMGGADSIDKHFRKQGIDWFPQEVIKQNDVYKIPSNVKIDVVISHTCPTMLLHEMVKYNPAKWKDCSNDALQYVYDEYKPKKWFFGHWHVNKKIIINGTIEFQCLNMSYSNGSWVWYNKGD